MTNFYIGFLKIIFALVLCSCGQKSNDEIKNVDNYLTNYSSPFKKQFINEVLIKKCSSFQNRDIEKYSMCIKDTKNYLNKINWELFDSLKTNQQASILLPCNSSMIRSPSKFSSCLNKQLEGFEALPRDIKESYDVAKQVNQSTNSNILDSWLDIFQISNSNKASLSGEEIFKLFEKSVFMILAQNKRDNFVNQGSAVAVSPDMLFTNCHVVLDKQGRPLEVIAFANDSVNTQSWFNAKIFKMNSLSDQCILLSTEKKNLQYIPMERKTSELNIGEQVMTLGYPMASNLDFDSKYRAPLTLSKGIISAIRDINNISHIQTDAFIIDGSSGGALLDMKGNLIGITTSGFEGTQLNFAIAVDEYENL